MAIGTRSLRKSVFSLTALKPGVSSDAEILADYADEVALLHGLPADETRARMERFMAVYHYGTETGSEQEWGAIMGGEVEHSLIRVSKPFRFRDHEVMPTVLRAIERRLQATGEPRRALDYGGGFGNDSIVFARSGFETHYADLTSLKNTDIVRKRFEVRGLDIPVHDSYALPELEFAVISAIDVLEHIYDVEEATAQLLARLAPGGLLCCVNAFSTITYDGDHHDKNRVYVELFPLLMRAAGMTLAESSPPVEVYRRDRARSGDVAAELAELRPLLYRTTREHCIARCRTLLPAAAPPDAIDWGRLPGADTVGSSADTAARRSRAYATAARLAPAFVKAAVFRRREQRMRAALATTEDPTDALGALADHVAVLRIAEHRLKTLG